MNAFKYGEDLLDYIIVAIKRNDLVEALINWSYHQLTIGLMTNHMI